MAVDFAQNYGKVYINASEVSNLVDENLNKNLQNC